MQQTLVRLNWQSGRGKNAHPSMLLGKSASRRPYPSAGPLRLAET